MPACDTAARRAAYGCRAARPAPPAPRAGSRRRPRRCRRAPRTQSWPGPLRGRGRPAATPAPARCGVLVAALALRFGMHGDRVVRIVLRVAPERDVLGMLVRDRKSTRLNS